MSSPLQLTNAATAFIERPEVERPKSLTEAARQFEALLIGQILQAARSEGDGWMGSGEDAGSQTSMDLAQEQFARVLSQHGGLGLSARIVADLSGVKSSQPGTEIQAVRKTA
ncbi:MAG: hypothetical protein U0Q18_14000 [Bryobacteraceae bacterium]